MNKIEMLREFHRAFDIPYRFRPHVPDRVSCDERFAVIEEEWKEVWDEFNKYNTYDLAKIAKELADLEYTIYSMAVFLGIDLDEVFNAIHKANMSKIGSNGFVKKVNGKVIKPSTYIEADIYSIIEKQKG